MPFARLTLADVGMPPDVQLRLVQGITDRLRDDLRKDPDVTLVHVNLVEPSRWFLAGDVCSETGAHLEISITAGTNTAEEKALFIRRTYDLLTSALDRPAETIYIALYELAADAYGYNGVTQAVRYGLNAPADDGRSPVQPRQRSIS